MRKTRFYVAIKSIPLLLDTHDIVCNTKKERMFKVSDIRYCGKHFPGKNLPMINHRPDSDDFKENFRELILPCEIKLFKSLCPHLPTNKCENFHEDIKWNIRKWCTEPESKKINQ